VWVTTADAYLRPGAGRTDVVVDRLVIARGRGDRHAAADGGRAARVGVDEVVLTVGAIGT
jgi:hypothetical protein